MKRIDLIGGVIKSIWNEDDGKTTIIVETVQYGIRGVEAIEFDFIREEEYDDEQE